MKKAGIKEKILAAVLALVVVAAVVYSANCLFVKGVLSWHIRQSEYLSMMAEVCVLLGLFAAVLRWAPTRRGIVAGIAIVMSAFLWVHVAFLPVLVSGLYVWYLCRLGTWIRCRLLRAAEEGELIRDFLVGAMAMISLFCLMSAIGVGSIPCMQAVVVASGLLLAVREWRSGKWNLHGTEAAAEKRDWSRVLGMAFILAMFCIQAGRMNIAVDYDSLWYGIRSPYILDNGHGIYENMGTVGVVYTYSKGLETLTLPLSSLPSYGFQISFNFWLAAGVLLVVYRIADRFMGRKLAWSLTVLISSIPGIMNMTITAKTDIATLLVQAVMIEELLRLLDEEEGALAYSLSAFLLSWTLKPTALVFSSAVYGMGVVGILIIRGVKASLRMLGSMTGEHMLVILLGAGTLSGIWARTLMITGMPVTSVFSSVFSKLGFTMKYPYSLQTVPNSGSALSGGEWLRMFAKRLYGVLLDPGDEALNHVIIAWGSLWLFFFICIWLVAALLAGRARDRKQRQQDLWINLVFLPFLAGNLLSLAMLTQVDGNYFMLLYVLAGVYAFRLLARIEEGGLQKTAGGLAVVVMLYSAVVSGATNWSWTLGFTPVNLINRGYLDHKLVERDEMRMKGSGQIWDILESQPESRVIAIGQHPDVLALPCSVQSFDDLYGQQGNIELVSTKESFREYLKWAKTDYIYIQSGYMTKEEQAGRLMYRMIEHGTMIPVCYAAGDVLFAVDAQGEKNQEAEARLKEFLTYYQYKE